VPGLLLGLWCSALIETLTLTLTLTLQCAAAACLLGLGAHDMTWHGIEIDIDDSERGCLLQDAYRIC
jgi:hypothetical protein